MTTVAILPVKALDKAKQRLSDAVALGNRRALAEAMYTDVLVAARRAKSIDRILVITADRTAARIAGGYGAEVVHDTGSSHTEAAEVGLAAAATYRATRVLLLPGDCPLIDPAQLDALLARPTPDRSALIIPDRHGTGTNGLLLSPPDALTPSFGTDSCQRHFALANAQGSVPEVVEVPTLALDVDTPDDYQLLQEMFATTRGGAANTRGLVNQLARSAASIPEE